MFVSIATVVGKTDTNGLHSDLREALLRSKKLRLHATGVRNEPEDGLSPKITIELVATPTL